MRTLNPAATALLARLTAGEPVSVVQLVYMALDVPQYLTTAGCAVVWGGHTWQPVAGRIEPTTAAEDGSVDGLQFTLPGVAPDQLAVVLTEQVEGRNVQVYDALVDPQTGAVADAVLAWAGTLNVPALSDGPTAEVAVSAEHRAVHAQRAKPIRYTHDEQMRLYPGDTCLNFDPATDAAPLAWPAASFFKV